MRAVSTFSIPSSLAPSTHIHLIGTSVVPGVPKVKIGVRQNNTTHMHLIGPGVPEYLYWCRIVKRCVVKWSQLCSKVSLMYL